MSERKVRDREDASPATRVAPHNLRTCARLFPQALAELRARVLAI
jgi:hypothetical protein